MSNFTLRGADGMSAASSVLGLWTTLRVPDSEVVSFDASAIPSEALVWHVSLPMDVQKATAQLDGGMARLRASERELGAASQRIDTLVQTQKSGASFDVMATALLPQPEVELLKSLQTVKNVGQPISFGLGEQLASGWQQATQQFQSVVDRLINFFIHYAWVESDIEGKLLGRTVVNWRGDMDTAWRTGCSPTEAALHERTLALALASRQTLLHTFVVASRGAVTLATLPALLATPAGVLLALPAAWKFVNQVLAELDRQ